MARGLSSAGRALQWHCRGHRFDPGRLHHFEKFGKNRADAPSGRPFFLPATGSADRFGPAQGLERDRRSEEHTSELQSLMRISYAVFCLKKKKYIKRD